MKFSNYAPFLFATLLCSLSFVWAAPIGRHGDLVKRNPEPGYNGRLVARMPPKASSSSHAPKHPTVKKSAKSALTGAPNPAAARRHPVQVKMTGGAKAALAASGLTHEHFGGKSPEQWSHDHVKQHIEGSHKFNNVKSAAIIYPPHEGGRGGNGNPVDPTNHFTVQIRKYGATKGENIHIPVPEGTPKVHFKGEAPHPLPPVAGPSTQHQS